MPHTRDLETAVRYAQSFSLKHPTETLVLCSVRLVGRSMITGYALFLEELAPSGVEDELVILHEGRLKAGKVL